jgi:RNA polymerase sigma factor (sigma-70 family)
MTATTLPTISSSDAELITASRNGNREAFGQIVRKYQSMISGLIYAACGDLHRSEDIAQETFISAWKSLSGLRDAAKLPGWLCQIARHRIADHFREFSTQKVQLQEQLAETIPAEVPDQAMSAEEGEMLWRTLARIPQPYRETMVLYYRQGQSTADVAAAMETTDAGVRQRLTRGRQMLRDEMAAMVERNLAKSAPGPEFSLAVMASLPMAAAQTAALTATAKGSAAAKSGFLFFLTTWIAPLAAILSMGMITGHSIYRAKPGAQKRFVIGYWIVFWLVIAGWVMFSIALIGYGQRRHWDYPTFIPVLSLAWGSYSILIFTLTALTCPRTEPVDQGTSPPLFRTFFLRFIFLTPLLYLGVGWLVRLAVRAGDPTSAVLIGASVIVGSAICAARGPKNGRHNPVKMLFESWMVMEVIALLAINLRMRPWAAIVDHVGYAYSPSQMPLWSVNVAGAVLFLWMLMIVRWRRGYSEAMSRA